MFKKYLIAALIVLCAAYIVHTRSMTLAEEQPFLDERTDDSFLGKFKNFLETNQSDVTTPAAAQTVAKGTRPRKQSAIRRGGATRTVVDDSDDDDIDEKIESAYAKATAGQESASDDDEDTEKMDIDEPIVPEYTSTEEDTEPVELENFEETSAYVDTPAGQGEGDESE